MLTGGKAAAHWRQALEVRGTAGVDAAGLLARALSSFCSLVNSFFSAANSIAVGGGADTVTAAATGELVGKTGGKRSARGKSVIERSS